MASSPQFANIALAELPFGNCPATRRSHEKIVTQKTPTSRHAEPTPEIAKWDKRRAKLEAWLRANIDSDAIYRLAAGSMLESEEMGKAVREYEDMLNLEHQFLSVLRTDTSVLADNQKLAIAEFFDSATNMAVAALKHGVQITKRRAKEINADGGRARWKNDPKTPEKELVATCWREWKLHPSRYRSKAAFARDVLQKCEHLTSQKQIEDWCRAWEKLEAK